LSSLSNVSFGLLFNFSFPKERKFLAVLLFPFYVGRTQIKVKSTFFIIPTDAHDYKSVEMLKQFKSYNTCPDTFRLTQEPSSGSSLRVPSFLHRERTPAQQADMPP
jgi:hypothetical protein